MHTTATAAAQRPATTPRPAVSVDVGGTEWDAFVLSRPDATGYHLWGWRDVFERAFGHPCPYLVARVGGRVAGVLPLVEVRGWPFGRALSSLPYVNYGGVLAETEDAGRALVQEAGRLATARALSYVVLRHRRRMLSDRPARTHKVTMLLRLPSREDALWAALDRKVRNQIRKAEKSGLTIAAGGEELLDEFYAVFARNMRDLGTPVYGRELFAAILSAFPSEARLHLARLDGRTVAGAFSYGFRDTLEVPSASSLREYRALCPNHLLYWSILRGAIAERRAVFDFGRSTPDDGTYRFKEQWGAVPEQLWWEYELANGAAVPSDDRHSAKFQATIEAWKRLPVAVATLIGPRIARSIP